MIGAYDASLPQLAAIGSGSQWGTRTFSERTDIEDKIKVVEQALRYQSTGEGDPIRIFIAEAEIPPSAVDELPASVRIRTDDGGKMFLAVGSVMLTEGMFPHYMRPHFDKDAIREALDGTKDYIYLEAFITDFRTGPWRKGSGSALIDCARQFCRERGLRTIYLDAYAGNGRKLVRYYENQGFTVAADCEHPMPDGSKWPCAFFRLDLTE